MKILHIVSDLGQGGAQSYVCDLIRDQSSREGVEIYLLALFFKGALWDRVQGLGITLDCLEMPSAADLTGVFRLRRVLRDHPADIVHVHAIHPAISYLICGMRARAVYTEHGGGLLRNDWKFKLVYWFFWKNYCRFIAISEMMASVMCEINPSISSRIRVVHNGTDLDRIDAAPSVEDDDLPKNFAKAEFRVGIIGRLVAQKGVATFLDAAANIACSIPNVVFVIIGDGPLRMELERLAVQLGIDDKVTFLGYRTDAIGILKRLDVVLFTSYSEAFGLVIAEAMGAGIPVVALHGRDAVREIIDDGENGFVVDGRDPQRLAGAVIGLLADPELRSHFGRNSRRKVEERFTMKCNTDKVLSLYRECLSEPR